MCLTIWLPLASLGSGGCSTQSLKEKSNHIESKVPMFSKVILNAFINFKFKGHIDEIKPLEKIEKLKSVTISRLNSNHQSQFELLFYRTSSSFMPNIMVNPLLFLSKWQDIFDWQMLFDQYVFCFDTYSELSLISYYYFYNM